MITRSPCDAYLKYLLSHPAKYPDDQIRTLVKMQKLDFLGMPHLTRLREDCVPPTPFYPENQRHHKSQRFLRKEKIYSLYHRDDETICAFEILENAKLKELVETLILSATELSWICGALRKKGFSATPRAIQRYMHYFFDISKMDEVDVQSVMAMRVSTLNTDSEDDADEGHFLNTRYKVSRYSPQNLVANMAIKPFANMMNIMRLGYMPSVDIGRILSMGRTAAVLRTVDAVLTGKSKSAVDFGMTAKMLSEMVEAVGDVGEDLNAAIMRMTLQQDSAPIPTIDELAGDNHTMSLLPIDVEGESIEEDGTV